jgi:hypothetical protein
MCTDTSTNNRQRGCSNAERKLRAFHAHCHVHPTQTGIFNHFREDLQVTPPSIATPPLHQTTWADPAIAHTEVAIVELGHVCGIPSQRMTVVCTSHHILYWYGSGILVHSRELHCIEVIRRVHHLRHHCQPSVCSQPGCAAAPRSVTPRHGQCEESIRLVLEKVQAHHP